MLVSVIHMRAGARRLARGTLLLLPLAGCAGGDLLLPENPDDRAPVQLRAVSGDGQAAPVGSPVPNPLVVEALDRSGRPVEGAVIVFEFVDPPNGAAIAPPVSETDPDGLAQVEVTLGTPPGDQPVQASLEHPERELSVRFLLTAIRTGDGGGGDEDPPPDGGDGGGGEDGGNGGGGDDGGNGGGDEGGGDDDGNGGGGNGSGDDDGEGGGGDDDDDDDDDDSGKGDGKGEDDKGGKGRGKDD